MRKFLYYNTLYQVTTDGKKVWDDKNSSNGFVPKGRAMIYYKLNGKLISMKQLLNSRYLVYIKKESLPF